MNGERPVPLIIVPVHYLKAHDLHHVTFDARAWQLLEFCLDFEAVMLYSMLRIGGDYDQSRHHLRGF